MYKDVYLNAIPSTLMQVETLKNTPQSESINLVLGHPMVKCEELDPSRELV